MYRNSPNPAADSPPVKSPVSKWRQILCQAGVSVPQSGLPSAQSCSGRRGWRGSIVGVGEGVVRGDLSWPSERPPLSILLGAPTSLLPSSLFSCQCNNGKASLSSPGQGLLRMALFSIAVPNRLTVLSSEWARSAPSDAAGLAFRTIGLEAPWHRGKGVAPEDSQVPVSLPAPAGISPL